LRTSRSNESYLYSMTFVTVPAAFLKVTLESRLRGNDSLHRNLQGPPGRQQAAKNCSEDQNPIPSTRNFAHHRAQGVGGLLSARCQKG
jgi:hypothetical protein